MSEVTKEFTSPIRLMFGIGNHQIFGFAIVYEDLYEGEMSLSVNLSSAGLTPQSVHVWFDEDLFSKVKFISAGESCIVWDLTYVPGRQSYLFTTEDHFKRTVKEIRIRRDFQCATRPS